MSSSTSDRALKVLSNLPPTPGRQVKFLREELEKKETENDTLKSNISDLTKALNSLQIVKEKVAETNNPILDEKSKKKKDADAPKSAMTAYRYFCEDNPNLAEGNNMRQLWKECKGAERQKYTVKAEIDKFRFEKENEIYQKRLSEKEAEDEALRLYYEKQKQDLAMEFYEAHMQVQATTAAGKKTKKKDPNAPKAPLSSYIFFCQDKRDGLARRNPKLSVTELSKLLGEEWSKAKQKKNGIRKYEDQADKDKKRYEEEKKVYDEAKAEQDNAMKLERETKLQKDREEAMKLLKEKEVVLPLKAEESKPEKKKKVKDPNAPKAASSGYIFFCKEMREVVKSKNPSLSSTEVTKILGEEWTKAKNNKETAKYDEMAAADKARYEAEKEEYNAKLKTTST